MSSSVQRLREWFYPQASIMSYYSGGERPEEELTRDFKKHARRCKLVWVTEPNVGHIDGFGGDREDDHDDEVLGIVAKVGCKCGRYRTDLRPTELFIPGRFLLNKILDEVKQS